MWPEKNRGPTSQNALNSVYPTKALLIVGFFMFSVQSQFMGLIDEIPFIRMSAKVLYMHMKQKLMMLFRYNYT